MLGILVATLANHACASAVGTWLVSVIGAGRDALDPRTVVHRHGGLDADSGFRARRSVAAPRYGVFLTTAVAFFLVEMGDKTQIATVALAAQFHSIVLVVLGTTLGMMLANVPVVFAGDALIRRVPLKWCASSRRCRFVALGALRARRSARDGTCPARALRSGAASALEPAV